MQEEEGQGVLVPRELWEATRPFSGQEGGTKGQSLFLCTINSPTVRFLVFLLQSHFQL